MSHRFIPVIVNLYDAGTMNANMCEIKIMKCVCLIDDIYYRNESNAMLEARKICKEGKLIQDCINKIEDCNHSTTLLTFITYYEIMKEHCKTGCHASLMCSFDLQNTLGSSSNPYDVNGNVCRYFRTLFQCFSANTKACDVNRSENWLRIERSFEALCSDY